MKNFKSAALGLFYVDRLSTAIEGHEDYNHTKRYVLPNKDEISKISSKTFILSQQDIARG